jgi:hypothetical protein
VQFLSLADVDDSTIFIKVHVNAGGIRQEADFILKVFTRVHT